MHNSKQRLLVCFWFVFAVVCVCFAALFLKKSRPPPISSHHTISYVGCILYLPSHSFLCRFSLSAPDRICSYVVVSTSTVKHCSLFFCTSRAVPCRACTITLISFFHLCGVNSAGLISLPLLCPTKPVSQENKKQKTFKKPSKLKKKKIKLIIL